MRQPCVYSLTNRRNLLVSIGVTSDSAARMMQHRAGEGSAHCRRYNIRTLVHVEFHATMHEAIAREKAPKEWRREWKRRLVSKRNRGWDELFEQLMHRSEERRAEKERVRTGRSRCSPHQ